MQQACFRQLIFEHFQSQGRVFPWRQTEDPYAITVSEFMLQQTQTERVLPKYGRFLLEVPTWEALAQLPVEHLLRLWQGLGYNRRVLNLQRAAQMVVSQFKGTLPRDAGELEKLPGIGPYTARAICVFAFNQPAVMIETNIRRVFLHHFFADQAGIADAALMPLIEETLDHANPRNWYYALMDYGAWLTKSVPNPNRRSKHYSKQSKFEGSNRQLRGRLVKILTEGAVPSLAVLAEEVGESPDRIENMLVTLRKEGFPVPLALSR